MGGDARLTLCVCVIIAVRLILEALISFMPTKGEGAIGALDFPAEERRRLAKQVAAQATPILLCAVPASDVSLLSLSSSSARPAVALPTCCQNWKKRTASRKRPNRPNTQRRSLSCTYTAWKSPRRSRQLQRRPPARPKLSRVSKRKIILRPPGINSHRHLWCQKSQWWRRPSLLKSRFQRQRQLQTTNSRSSMPEQRKSRLSRSQPLWTPCCTTSPSPWPWRCLP